MRSIPVLEYHHINWYEKDANTLTPKEFDREMKHLSSRGYHTLLLNELVNYLEKGGNLPPKPIVITFDDGFKDTALYAYPILKKYALKATIFVITSAIKDKRVSSSLQTHFKSLAGTVLNEDGSDDFLSWEEIREMEESGLIDIQSHTHYHSRYYINEEIIGYNEGKYWWIGWATDGDSRLGIPLYKNTSALIAHRYYDDVNLRNRLADYVEKQGGKDFFKKKRKIWERELSEIVKEYKSNLACRQTGNKLQGHYESLKEKEKRIRKELNLSKEIIEEKLNKKCQFLAWPWGKYNEEVIKMARECGYRGAVTTDEKGINTFGSSPMSVKRIDTCVGNKLFFPLRLKLHL